MRPQVVTQQNQWILYDADVIATPDPGLFEPAVLEARGQITGEGGGRGRVLFLAVEGHQLALRHYMRGGDFARFFGDAYLWQGLRRTRPWHEWRILELLSAEGFPVPEPVAARVIRRRWVYTADLITRRIPGAESVDASLRNRPLSSEEWRSIGAGIRRFHDRGVFHADLNSRNILLDSGSSVHLIDFDRARIRPKSGWWKRRNLLRLQHDLKQLSKRHAPFHFESTAFSHLLEGYDHYNTVVPADG